MKTQWTLILSFLFALIVAIFAVVNVNAVEVNYVFGTTELPLILIILGSTLLGGVMVGLFGLFRMFVLQRKVNSLMKEKQQLETHISQLEQTNIPSTESNEEPLDSSVEKQP